MAGSSAGWFKSTKGAKGRTFIARSVLEEYIAGSPERREAPGTSEDHLETLRADLRAKPSYVTYVALSMGAKPPKGMAKTKRVEKPKRTPRDEPRTMSPEATAKSVADFVAAREAFVAESKAKAEEAARVEAAAKEVADREAAAEAAAAAKKTAVGVARKEKAAAKKAAEAAVAATAKRSAADAPATGRYTGPLRSAAERERLAELKSREFAGPMSADKPLYIDTNKKVMQRVIAETNLTMRVPSAVLGKILDDGFKNQYQTGTSRGLYSPTVRKKAEVNMFGIPPGSKAEAYPVYGYLSPKEGGEGKAAAVYGDAQIIFKEAVRDRTTFSVGDSLGPARNEDLMPAPVHAPDMAAVAGFGRTLFKYASEPTRTLLSAVGYFEIQIHGKTSATDIAEVRFAPGSTPSGAVTSKLDALGIKWAVG